MTRLVHAGRLPVLMIGAVFLLGVATVTKATALVDTPATRLLDEVAAAYKALPAYSDQGTLTLQARVSGETHGQATPASLAFARPNKLRVDAGAATLTCDGTTLASLVGPAKKYASGPAPKQIGPHHVAGSPVGSLLLGGPAGPAMQVMVGLLLDENPARAAVDQAESLELGADVADEGVSCRVVSWRDRAGTRVRMLIAADTKLVRAIELVPDEKAIASLFGKEAGVAITSYRWTAGKVNREVPDATFALEVPKDFAKVGELAPAARAGADGPKFEVQTLVGKPAPAATLTLLDGPGKTRAVPLGDLAGKVVLIDFWATWCGPCLAELPEIQKLVESLARAKKPVVVVALSQDNAPRDLDAVRKLVENTLAEKKITIATGDVGKVGIDPSNSVGEAFKVEGYPTVVLIDEKGIVRAAHVGNNAAIGQTLDREIDRILEGKPLENDASRAQPASRGE